MSDKSWWSDLAAFATQRMPDLWAATVEHLWISALAVVLGCLVAIPVGILLANSSNRFLKSFTFGVANLFQTIPSLALLALLIPLMGIGMKPAIFALFLYALLPLLRNTYAGMESADRSILEAAKGMGYGPLQRIVFIQLPIALPYIISGIRVTTVYIISWTTLASLIGGGGLGVLIFSGLGVNKDELIIMGALAAIVLALLADYVLGLVEKRSMRKKPMAAASKPISTSAAA
ncbi:Choline transport system permease protein OpuBB [Paenibacillus solanacearum]|uniref:Choline transport system permease protein OpuBB n=1 Tax=Paenibacillus solanacearum TaxID=2048548 RepID=A0A916K7D7_9BACL|nr:ABC transporter permease [Paenibacillus solanacearum]CAG7649763.1 Choline transport system permease protein OpuBB [Paenibacillus solanacearum]